MPRDECGILRGVVQRWRDHSCRYWRRRRSQNSAVVSYLDYLVNRFRISES
jgi:hypothetical protein